LMPTHLCNIAEDEGEGNTETLSTATVDRRRSCCQRSTATSLKTIEKGIQKPSPQLPLIDNGVAANASPLLNW
jgi:hypothetical protein